MEQNPDTCASYGRLLNVLLTTTTLIVKSFAFLVSLEWEMLANIFHFRKLLVHGVLETILKV